MASEKKLDCVILGLLSHEDLTGYQIKKRMDTALHYFWGASYGSIYPTLDGLVRGGLATRRESRENGRGKLVYSITSEGREHLRTWLAVPAERDELRYETLLKLFFSGEGGPAAALPHIARLREKAERELPYLTGAAHTLEAALASEHAQMPVSEHMQTEIADHTSYLLTVLFGLKFYHACLEWCGEAEQMLHERKGDV